MEEDNSRKKVPGLFRQLQRECEERGDYIPQINQKHIMPVELGINRGVNGFLCVPVYCGHCFEAAWTRGLTEKERKFIEDFERRLYEPVTI